MIRKLCKEHTRLSKDDVNQIIDVARNLQYIADLVQADIFIDCLTRNTNVAIVLGQAKPIGSPSLYKKYIVGELAYRDNEPATLRTLETGIPTRDLKAINQEKTAVRQWVVPIKNANNETIAAIAAEMDITANIDQERNIELLSQTNDQLTENLRFFQKRAKEGLEDLYWHVNDSVILFDKKGHTTYANPSAKALYTKMGYKDQIENLHFKNISLTRIDFETVIREENFQNREIIVGDLCLSVKYGAIGQGLIMLIRDITDAKNKEKELVLKSYAIQEIHHRVKNNLQMVASLLGLQSRRIENPEIRYMFHESINRILSIAVTHEVLAQNGLDDVDIKTILSTLIDNLKFGSQNDIKIKITGDSIFMNSDYATSTALVTNELINNAAEHAFIGMDHGEITVSIGKGFLYSTISVSDNGMGFDLHQSERKANTLGLNIVKNIVADKLEGKLAIESTKLGTKVVFDFKN